MSWLKDNSFSSCQGMAWQNVLVNYGNIFSFDISVQDTQEVSETARL